MQAQTQPMVTEDYYEIDLRDIFFILRKHLRLLIVLPLVASLVAGIIVFYVVDPVYAAVTTLLVTQERVEPSLLYNDIRTNRELVKTYREIARSRTVLETVVKRLDLSVTPEQLRETIEVSLRGETEIIEVSVEHTDPVMAQWIAQHTADVFMTRVQELMKVDNVKIVDPAVVPANPVKPNKQLTIIIAAFLGLMMAVGLAFLFEYLDNTVKTAAEVEALTGLPVLGVIPSHAAKEGK